MKINRFKNLLYIFKKIEIKNRNRQIKNKLNFLRKGSINNEDTKN